MGLKQLRAVQGFQPSLHILSEYSTMSDNGNRKNNCKDTIDYILNAPQSEISSDSGLRLSDSTEIVEYEEYIGSNYGGNDKEDEHGTVSDSECDAQNNNMKNVELSLIKEAELSDFVGDARWQMAIQNAYLKGFNKGYGLGAQFGFKQASK